MVAHSSSHRGIIFNIFHLQVLPYTLFLKNVAIYCYECAARYSNVNCHFFMFIVFIFLVFDVNIRIKKTLLNLVFYFR